MGIKKRFMDKITQMSIGFKNRQHLFLDQTKNNIAKINLDEICRDALDNQIALIDPSFLDISDPRYKQ